MKNRNDLEKIGLKLQKKYKDITFEIKEKPYPESIIPGAKIVDSMWLFIKYKNILFTSGRLNSLCDDDVFDLHIKDLENNLKEKILGIKIENNNDLLF